MLSWKKGERTPRTWVALALKAWSEALGYGPWQGHFHSWGGRQRMCTVFKYWPQPAAGAAKNPSEFLIQNQRFLSTPLFCHQLLSPCPLQPGALRWMLLTIRSCQEGKSSLEVPGTATFCLLREQNKGQPLDAGAFSPCHQFAGAQREGQWCHGTNQRIAFSNWQFTMVSCVIYILF